MTGSGRFVSRNSRRSVVSLLAMLMAGCSAPFVDNPKGRADFATRCADPGVIRCFGFERDELATNGGPIQWSAFAAPAGTFVNGMADGADLTGRIELARDHKASGESSLKFHMPSTSYAGFASQFYANFADDLSVQFGEGETFYVQWRQRFSRAFLDNRYRPHNTWKQVIVGEGDRPGTRTRTCTQLELVVYRESPGTPAMYHSCRGKDGRSEGIRPDWPVEYVADQWMTFHLSVKIGTWYQNDRSYRKDSMIELWVAREGEPARKVISRQYDLASNDPQARYGKIWLLPYLTGKDHTQKHADAYTWYDELIISRTPIADPL